MNARINDSNERSGSDTNKYQAMLKEAWKLEAQRQLQQEQRFWHRFDLPKRRPHQQYLKATKSVDVTIPRDVEDISTQHTTLLYPGLKQQTDALDISFQATQIEPFDAATVLAGMADLECTNLPNTEPRRQKITIQLEDEEPQVLQIVNGILSAQELIETAIGEYGRQYSALPTRVRISPSTLLRIDGRLYWTHGEQTYYQSKHYGPCPVQIDITLDHMTVQCEEAERTN